MRMNKEEPLQGQSGLPREGLSTGEVADIYKDYIKKNFLQETQNKQEATANISQDLETGSPEATAPGTENSEPDLPVLEVPETLGKILNFLKESQEAETAEGNSSEQWQASLQGLLEEISEGEPALATRKLAPIFRKVSENYSLDYEKVWADSKAGLSTGSSKGLVLSFHEHPSYPGDYCLNLSETDHVGFNVENRIKVEDSLPPVLKPTKAKGLCLEVFEGTLIPSDELEGVFRELSQLFHNAENEAIKSNRTSIRETLDSFALHYFAGWELQEELEELYREASRFVKTLERLSRYALAELEEERPGIAKEVRVLHRVSGYLKDTLPRELDSYTQAIIPFLGEALVYRKSLLDQEQESRRKYEERLTIEELLYFMK